MQLKFSVRVAATVNFFAKNKALPEECRGTVRLIQRIKVQGRRKTFKRMSKKKLRILRSGTNFYQLCVQ
ncbi:unnamed protein product [Parnassius apollo]|uniref:(apollo) hypothetical protein n=1 Tax=Parnassius apollo TaxID=110799 RepID=A0A8S3W6Q2_PARAO|nr:unnamed protein product [Parnassius apollo]